MALTSIKPRLKPMTAPTKTHWGNSRGGRPWRRLRDEILLRDLYTCQHCHRVFNPSDLECDHIINTANGGTDDPTNLQSLCKPCHQIKTLAESQAGVSKNFKNKNRRTPRPLSFTKKITIWRKNVRM